jgi:DNA-directed RNA polymerase subunit RPC12/RpoP
MQKYFCKTCNNKFFDYSSEIFNCPYCGSNDIQLKTKPAPPEYWKTPLFIFSVVGLVVMLIVLFILPSAMSKYEVNLTLMPKICKVFIVVKNGNAEENSNLFSYSSDNGKTWQQSNELASENPATYSIKVKHNRDSAARFTYLFEQPVRFTPDCKPPLPDPCDCRNLQILTVEQKQQKLIIHTSLPKCQILFSITGKDATFNTDSSFSILPSKDYFIFIKTPNCTPVSYSKNPYHTTPIVHTESLCSGYLLENEVTSKAYPVKIGESTGILVRYIEDQLRDQGIKGNFNITICVESFGSISSIKIFPSTDQNVKNKIQECIMNLGNWEPGYKNGNTVNSLVKVSISL